MKESSKEFLNTILPHLHAMLFDNLDEYFEDYSELAYEEHNSIIDLYTMYTSYEIDDYNHIVDATTDFFDFLTSSQQYQNDSLVRDAINRAYRIVNRYINKFLNVNAGSGFAKSALQLSPTPPENSHILDVGPGYTPYSSLSFANSSKKVSAMDKDYLFSTQSLSSMNVDAKKQYFEEKTPVDEYDFVVGCRPCSAIPYIVSQCHDANKPYFLQLCDCAIYDRNLPMLNSFAKKGKIKWHEILSELDPNIKFYDEYAFNLDATPEQVKQIISKTIFGRTPSTTSVKLTPCRFDSTSSTLSEIDTQIMQK